MLDFLVEQRLQEAVSRGELDNLPGAGRPLELDDDPLVPEDLRVAYRMLKNAGFVPPELETVTEIGWLERLVAETVDDAARARAVKKLALLRTKLESAYYDKAVARLTTASPSPRGRG
jgi:DnaJ-like protein